MNDMGRVRQETERAPRSGAAPAEPSTLVFANNTLIPIRSTSETIIIFSYIIFTHFLLKRILMIFLYVIST